MKKSVLLISAALFVAMISSCSKDDGGISFEEQLAKDLAIIDNHILENDIDAEMHDSGIRYINSTVGEGESTLDGDRAVIKLQIAKLDENVISEDTIGFTITLSDPTLIALQLMIPEMNVGGKMKIFAPSGYCFGVNDLVGFPPNTNLIFWIELLDVVKNEDDQLIADQNIIDEFLQEGNIGAIIDESGIRYTIQKEGTGDSPTLNDQITVKYKGTVLNGFEFDKNNEGVTFSLLNLIEAWRIMIPKMKEGGKITIYSPSGYCYGVNGSSSIPPNTILVFEIELISIL